MEKNRLELCKIYGFHERFADIMRVEKSYEHPIKFLENIVEKTAQLNSISKEDLWTKIAKGLFTGEMMHLRIFEKTFGPKTLRVIASYRKNISQNEKDIFDDDYTDDTYEKYMSYFNAKPEEREKLADELIRNG